jgi:hypothetical protein
MKVANLRSSHDVVGGLVHFGRMVDKVRLHLQDKLPTDYHENLGKGFDERCLTFLQVTHAALVERVKQGGSDEEILAWCYAHGRMPREEEIEIWNDFMRKRGWHDAATERLEQRKKEAGLAHRKDIVTFFDLCDFDEERLK